MQRILEVVIYKVVDLLLLVYGSDLCILADAMRNSGRVSWGENYAGSSGLASPKLFTPLHFVHDTESTAAV